MFAASYAVQEDQRARERLIVQRHARRQREAGENGNWSQKESGPFLGGGGQPSVDLQKDGASGQLLDGRALRSAGPQGHPMSFGPPRVLISLQGQVAPCPDGAVVGCTSTHRYKRNTGRGKGGIGFRVTVVVLNHDSGSQRLIPNPHLSVKVHLKFRQKSDASLTKPMRIQELSQLFD